MSEGEGAGESRYTRPWTYQLTMLHTYSSCSLSALVSILLSHCPFKIYEDILDDDWTYQLTMLHTYSSCSLSALVSILLSHCPFKIYEDILDDDWTYQPTMLRTYSSCSLSALVSILLRHCPFKMYEDILDHEHTSQQCWQVAGTLWYTAPAGDSEALGSGNLGKCKGWAIHHWKV